MGSENDRDLTIEGSCTLCAWFCSSLRMMPVARCSLMEEVKQVKPVRLATCCTKIDQELMNLSLASEQLTKVLQCFMAGSWDPNLTLEVQLWQCSPLNWKAMSGSGVILRPSHWLVPRPVKPVQQLLGVSLWRAWESIFLVCKESLVCFCSKIYIACMQGIFDVLSSLFGIPYSLLHPRMYTGNLLTVLLNDKIQPVLHKECL